jgi:hypothetical protein
MSDHAQFYTQVKHSKLAEKAGGIVLIATVSGITLELALNYTLRNIKFLN